jgi:hypothetical protein
MDLMIQGTSIRVAKIIKEMISNVLDGGLVVVVDLVMV